MRVGLMTREYPALRLWRRRRSRRVSLARTGEEDRGRSPRLGRPPEPPDEMEPGHAEPPNPNLTIHFEQPWQAISSGTSAKFKGALEALSLNLLQQLHLEKLDVVHTHTWYVSMAGFLAKKLYDIPFVLTTHSLEPLRAWKAEQLGSGYALSSWMERTAILDADAIIAVSNGTKADILRAYPDVDPGQNPRHLQRHRPRPVPVHAAPGRAD